ncbi:hypothetical protein CRENBAI_011869, partial [Crenichthys baileyi]
MQNHQHPCQPSRNDRAKPSCGSPQAIATATPHILPYISRGTVETTNPKHTPPTRSHPADKQTPPQHKTEKPSEVRPAVQNTLARAAMHRSTTPTPQHAKQWRTVSSNEHPKRKPCTKPTPCKCAPTSPPKTKPPAKVHPHEKKTYSIQVQEHARPPCPCLKQPCEKTHTKAHKRQRAHGAKPTKKPRPVHPEISPSHPARQTMQTSPTSLPPEPGLA